jgi:predicted permease
LSLLRVGVGGLLAWAVANLFHVDATARSLLVLHGAMPTAVLNYMFAVRHERQPERVASFVLVSTGFSAATLPVLLWCIRAGG